MIDYTKFCRNWVLSSFLPVALVLGLGIYVIAYQEVSRHSEQLYGNERSLIRSTEMAVSMELENLSLSLRFLSGHEALHNLWDDGGNENFDILRKEFISFVDAANKFDQVRIVDLYGNEVLRVNSGRNGAYSVQPPELQNKSRSYYFKEAIKNGPSKVYVSDFDLNVEWGRVNKPFKPVIRAVYPLTSLSGEPKGFLIVNFLGKPILDRIEAVSGDSFGKIMFLTADGQWLFGGPGDCDWAFMFPDKEQCYFKDYYPGDWDRISSEQEGQFSSDNGLFTFKSVNLPDFGKVSDGDSNTTSEKTWKLVTHVSAEEIWKAEIQPYLIGAVVYAFVLLIHAFISSAFYRVKAAQCLVIDRLHASERRLREAEKIACLGSWEYNYESGELVWSDQTYRIFGYEPHEITPSFSRLMRHIVPEERRVVLEGASPGSGVYFMNINVLRKDGQKRSLRVKRQLVENNGVAVKELGTIHDITEIRERSEELQRLWRAVENCPTSIIITNAQADVEYVNSAFEELTGYSSDEIFGKNLRVLQSGVQTRGFYEQMWAELVSGKTWKGEMCNRKKNGEIFWERSVISPVVDERGVTTHFIGIKEDITELRHRDEEFRVAMQEFEALFENSSIGIAYMKQERIFHRVNSRFCEILGYSQSEIIGETTQSLYLSDDHYQSFWNQTRNRLAAGKVVQKEMKFRRRDGSIIWVAVNGKAVAPPDLDAGIIWTMDDISVRKELEKMREDVERIMRHDLKAPLNGIINLPTLVAIGGNLSSDQKENLELISEAGKRMLSQINTSLDLYKIETGTFEYNPSQVDIARLFVQIVKEFSVFLDSKDLWLEIIVDGHQLSELDSFVVKGRKDFCHNMFSNILKNACEASPNGEGIIVVLERNGSPRVSIKNKGVVPVELREVFFEKYTTAGKRNGVGLGNYSARMLMEAQLGKIEMRTSEEEGTTITFIFSNG